MTSSQNILDIYPSNLYMNGFTYGPGTTTGANFNIDIQPGVCRDSNNIIDIVSDSVITLDIKHKHINGLDTGSIVSSHTYGLAVIADSSGILTTQSICFDQVNQYSPVLPAGYDSYRIIGYFFVNSSSSIEDFDMFGNFTERNFYFYTDIPIFTGTATISPQTINLVNWIPVLSEDSQSYFNDFTDTQISYIYNPQTANNIAYIGGYGSYSHQIVGSTTAINTTGKINVTIYDFLYQDASPGLSLSVTQASDALALYLSSYKFFV